MPQCVPVYIYRWLVGWLCETTSAGGVAGDDGEGGDGGGGEHGGEHGGG